MSFLSPWALYLFALAGGVILLYFLRRRARPYRVSAIFLWEEVERQERRAWRLARHSVLTLLLQLAALTCLVLALAGPALKTAGIPGRLALILDGSASMQASQGGKSRYELAVERAIGLLASAGGEVTVIQAQRHPRLLVPLTSDKKAAIAAVRSSRPTLEGEAPLGELLALLESQAPLGQFQRIVYLSDHEPEPTELPEEFPFELEMIPPPTAQAESRNLGLTAFALRPEPDPAAGYGVFIRVGNYSAQPERATLTIAAEGEVLLSQELELAAGEERALAFSFARPLPSYALAALEPEAPDDFPWDDRRYFAGQAWVGKVLWLGKEDRFLRGALLALGEFAITHDPEEGEFDLIVANGVEVPPGLELEGNLLLVNASFPPLVTLLEVEEFASPVEVEAEDHPLLEGVEPANFVIVRAARAALPPGGQALLRTGDLPLLYLKQEGRRKLCYLGFDLRWSNLGLTVDFPILMRNLLTWLIERPALQGQGLEPEVEVGDPLPSAGEWAPAIGLREAGVSADLPGLYRLGKEGPGYGRLLAVNLAASESKEAGFSSEGAGPTEVGPPRAAEGRPPHASWASPALVWAGFALGGLLLLALEALSYEGVVWPRPWLQPRLRPSKSGPRSGGSRGTTLQEGSGRPKIQARSQSRRRAGR